jgi:hypothetical protein
LLRRFAATSVSEFLERTGKGRFRGGAEGFGPWVSLGQPSGVRAKTIVPIAGDRGFESVSLHRRVRCEPDLLDQGADADLADYFGSIPNAELVKSVARRTVDRCVAVFRNVRNAT